MPSFTTSEFLASVRRLAHVPSADTTFTDNDLLAFANEEMQIGVVPQILSVREGFYMAPPLDMAIVQGQDTYSFPSRTIGGRIANISLVNGNYVYQYARTEVGQLLSTNISPESFYAFYLQGNSFVLIPIPSFGTLRIRYYRRPNQLVVPTDCAQITAISPTSLTVASIPTTWAATNLVDILQANPGFDSLGTDLAITSINSNIINFDSLPNGIAVGDWVALAETAPVIQMPLEFQPLLEQRVVIKVLEAQGYLPKAQFAQQKLSEMEKAVFTLINPRVDQNPKIIVTKNNTLGRWPRYRNNVIP